MREKRSNPDADLFKEAADTIPVQRKALLQWFSRHARILPWRISVSKQAAISFGRKVLRRNPYVVWIAEMMLQQTQVVTVIPYFEKWMKRFPDVRTLADATEVEVLRYWAGLGYYSRARNLHQSARILSKEETFPNNLGGWKSLPGIGPYTAGAILSLAFDLPEPIVDGNVIRVFSRLFGLNFLPGYGREHREAFWELAKLWSKGSRPGNANEGLMELGALICKSSMPLCDQCPLAAACLARKYRWQNDLPPVKLRPLTENVSGVALVVENRDRFFLERRSDTSFLAGHRHFPMFMNEGTRDWEKKFLQRFPHAKWDSPPVEKGIVRHSITNRRYVVRVFRATLRGKSIPSWVAHDEVEKMLTNSLSRKIWEAAKIKES